MDRTNALLAGSRVDYEEGNIGHVMLFDDYFSNGDKQEFEWDYWGTGDVWISFGCLCMIANLETKTFRSWHQTKDDDPQTAHDLDPEYFHPYEVVEASDRGQITWHNCLGLADSSDDEQVVTLFGALALWHSGELRIGYLPLSDVSNKHYLCEPDSEGLRALGVFQESIFRKCIELGCPGAEESSQRLPN